LDCAVARLLVRARATFVFFEKEEAETQILRLGEGWQLKGNARPEGIG
jgi:hypothetical protein